MISARQAGIEPCDGAPFAPRGGGDNSELTAELASTKEELSTALAKIKSCGRDPYFIADSALQARS